MCWCAEVKALMKGRTYDSSHRLSMHQSSHQHLLFYFTVHRVESRRRLRNGENIYYFFFLCLTKIKHPVSHSRLLFLIISFPALKERKYWSVIWNVMHLGCSCCLLFWYSYYTGHITLIYPGAIIVYASQWRVWFLTNQWHLKANCCVTLLFGN